MNENSPTCASPMPAITATRSGVAVASIAHVATTAFTRMMAAAAARTRGMLWTIPVRSSSMPSEMKNSPESRSRTGLISA